MRPANAAEILKQWQALHGLDAAPEAGAALGRAHRLALWRGEDGTPLVEHHAIAGMGHGVPIGPGPEDAPLGEAAPFILDVGLSSTAAIAGFFGLGEAAPQVASEPAPQAEAAEAPRDAEAPGGLDRIIAIGRDGIAQVTTAGAARSSQPGQPGQPGRPGQQTGPRRWLGQLLSGEPAPRDAAPEQPKAAPEPPAATGLTNPGQVIRRALRAAGLLDR